MVVSAITFAQGNGLGAQVGKGRADLSRQCLVTLHVQSLVRLLRLPLDAYPQRKLAVLLVRYPYIYILHQFAHHLWRFLAVLPELATIVIVTGDSHASLFCCPKRLER